MFDKLEDLLVRFEEVLNELGEPGVTDNQERFQKLMKEQSELQPIVDTYKEYKENKERLNDDRSKLEFELHNLLHKKKEKFTDKSEVLKEIKSVNDVLKDPDVGYEEKGMLIRTIVDQIVWDKENNKMYFDIIVH